MVTTVSLLLPTPVYMRIYAHICLSVHMFISPLTMAVSEKWDGDWLQRKSNCSLTLVETAKDLLVLVHLDFLTLPTIPAWVVPCSWFFTLGQSGFWLLLSMAAHSVFLIISLLPHIPLPTNPEILPPMRFFTNPWTSLVSWLWLFFAKGLPLGLHLFVPLLVLSAIHMPIWPACCCGFWATCSESPAICLAFAHPQCVSFISHIVSTISMPLTAHVAGPVIYS